MLFLQQAMKFDTQLLTASAFYILCKAGWHLALQSIARELCLSMMFCRWEKLCDEGISSDFVTLLGCSERYY